VQAQLTQDGFAVVMMTANEFSTASGELNATMMTQLNSLISLALASGRNLVVVGDISRSYGAIPSTTGPTCTKRDESNYNRREVLSQNEAKENVEAISLYPFAVVATVLFISLFVALSLRKKTDSSLNVA